MNLHIYPSPFVNESRMLREVGAIIELGLAREVVVAGVQPGGLPREEAISDHARVVRFRLFSAHPKLGKLGKAFGLIEYLFRVLFWAIRERPAIVNCHSLNVLPVGVLLRWLGRTQWLIYDAHELETERETLRGFLKKVSKWVEQLFIRHVDHVIVVCEPIAAWYRAEYSILNLTVIRNIPERPIMTLKSNVLRQNFSIPDTDLIFIYQGVLSKPRGILVLLEIFANVRPDRHIVFMGYGPAEADILLSATKHSNIHFQPAVKPEEIIIFTSSADVGLFFLTHEISLSYRYSLPNKFFEYLYADCPIIVSKSLVHLSQLTHRHNLGWVVDADQRALLALIDSITMNEIKAGVVGREDYAAMNLWHDEKVLFKNVFPSRLLPN